MRTLFYNALKYDYCSSLERYAIYNVFFFPFFLFYHIQLGAMCREIQV